MPFLRADDVLMSPLDPNYAGDDPVNVVDQSGMSTNAYCISLQGIYALKFLGAGGQVEGCLVETSTGQVGVTFTPGGGAALASAHSASLSLFNERSNANYLSQLGGWCDFYSGGAAAALPPLPVGPGISIGGTWVV
jgi:hypothetical protein